MKLIAIALATVSIVVFAPKTTVSAQAECPGDGDTPTPVEVPVTSVPIVATSTTDDYFVLYVNHDVDGTEVELPVLAKRGEAGSTTLAEHVEALTAERYRVEKYLIADPADVDGDCIDDITELDNLGTMNPVNAAAAVELSDGAVVIPDHETFEALTRLFETLALTKYVVIGFDTDRPELYFINTETHPYHDSFLTDVLGLEDYGQPIIRGDVGYAPESVAPNGNPGVYFFSSGNRSFSDVAQVHTLLASSMPLLEDNLAYWIASLHLRVHQPELPLYGASRIPLVFDADVYPETDFLALNPGEGYGLLRVMEPDDRPHPRDVVIYEALPNELPRMAGIISTVPQTPLSHVNLRAIQDDVPNAFIRDVLNDADVNALIGSYVRYRVSGIRWELRAATKAEVDAHYESSRPALPQTPQRDLSTTSVTPLSQIEFDDWVAFGVKAANVAVLRTLGFPEGTAPDGFAMPFYFYDEFMKHNNFYTRIETMLADSDFQDDYGTQEDQLKELRDDIEDAETPEWMLTALASMNEGFPAGINRRYRSSTNNEDLPGFNGAGLYDSKSQKPDEDEEDGLDKSLKEVYASLWNFRAFIERDFHRIDHLEAAMGILVHPSYQDELVNGVAVSFDPIYGRATFYYVNSQVGEDLVTNPEAHSVPEELLLGPYGSNIILSASNQVEPGQLLLSFTQLRQLRAHLEVIHDHFEGLYDPGPGEPFAMEIEFKITSDDVLAIKQARPWVFDSEGATNEAPVISSGSRTEFSYSENGTAIIYTFRATDPEGGAITWSLSGTDGDDFEISDTGALTFVNIPDFENPADADQDNDYLVTVVATDQGGLRDTLDVTITVTNSMGAEEPTITTTSEPSPYRENGTGAVHTFRAWDPQGRPVSWTVTGADSHAFEISSGGVLTFRSPPDFESPADSNGDNRYEISVVATDDQGLTDSMDVTVTVTNDDESVDPTISTRRPPTTYRENDTSVVYTFRASDPQRQTITWSLEGEDRGDFTITRDGSGQGVLAFITPPDFELPTDSDRQNDYELTVIAIVTDGHRDRLSFTVTVTDVNEGPEISRVGSPPGSVPENHDTSLVLARYSASDPEGSTVSNWRTSGADSGDFTINDQGELRFRNVPDYERPADSNRDNTYLFTVQVSDGSVYGSLEETVTVTPVNEAPVITTTGGSAIELRQDENRTSRLYTYRATDPELSTITWSVGGTDRRFFTIDEQGQFSFSENTPPNFEQPGDSGGDNVYDVMIQATDGGSNTASLPVTVTVRDVNEPPEIAGQPALSFAENHSTDRVLATYRASDPEDTSAVITRWSLSGTDGGDFIISENGELTFRNVPDYERAADSGRDNVYSFSVRASDGRNYGYLSVTVTVTDVNEPPSITTTSRTGFTVRENGTAAIHTFRATDPERSEIAWSLSGADGNLFAIYEGNVTFRNFANYEEPEDSGRDNVYDVTIQARDDIRNTATLPITVTVTDVDEPPEITGQQNLSFAENHATDRVLATYSATDPEDPFADITRWSMSGTDGGDFTVDESGQLRFRNTPDYERPADSGTDNVYNFSVRASDGSLYGYLPVTVTVTDVNEPPIITTVSSSAMVLRQDENRTSRLYTYRATDPERSTIAWSVGGVDRNFFTIDEQGQFSFSETSPPNFERPSDSGGDNVYDVTVEVRDDVRNTATLPVTVTVRDVNEPPEVTGQQVLSFAENHATDRVLAAYNATDPEDPSAEITRWSTSGTDGGDFTIDEQGELRFRNVPDYERPADSGKDNSYSFSVRASDGSLYGYLPVTVTVTDVNEPPTITTVSGSATELRQDENRTSRLYTYRATDPERRTIAWSVGGVDRNHFTIDDQGQFSFSETSPPNFEQPSDSGGDNVYDVTIEVRDDIRNTATLPVTVTVRDVNEPPEVTGQQALSFAENHATDSVLATYGAIDPENPSSLITRWSLSGTDGGDFTINESGELTFRNVPDYERPADSGKDNSYSFSVRASDGSLYGYLPVTVTVTDVNEPPTITTVSGSATTLRQDENRTSRLYTYRATDPERSTITWSVGGVDRNHFTIDEQGQFSFSDTSPPNFEQPADSGGDNVYDVTVEVRDDISNVDSLPVTVTVRDVNEPPEVGGQQTLSFTENQATDRVLATYNAIDPEDPSAVVTRWSLSGTDGGDFTINEQGELRFRNVPDYERPADSGKDNSYSFSVRASDGSLYGYLPVTVTVTDVNEPPTITTVSSSAMALRQNENRTSRLYTYRATDPERSTITWSVGGVDRNFFTIDEQGQFSFSETSPPNFEQPSDSGGDNVYDVTIEVRDDISNVDSLPVTVMVRDVNEPPDVTGQQGLSFAENYATESVLATYSAIDPEDTSALITRWSTSGTDGGDFTVNEQGELRFRNIPDYERPADSGSNNVYNFSVRASDGSLYGYLPVTVTVTDVNEPPAITTTSRTDFTVRENVTATIYTFRATDPEGGTIEWSTAGADSNDFMIEDGALRFAGPPNFEQPQGRGSDSNQYLVTIQASDDALNSGRLDVVVTVSDVNEGPEITRTGSAPGSVPENHDPSLVLARYTATDPEGGTVSRWRTSGTDGGDFTISQEGELTFRNMPDYERPADSNGDNTYVFTVQVSDGQCVRQL